MYFETSKITALKDLKNFHESRDIFSDSQCLLITDSREKNLNENIHSWGKLLPMGLNYTLAMKDDEKSTVKFGGGTLISKVHILTVAQLFYPCPSLLNTNFTRAPFTGKAYGGLYEEEDRDFKNPRVRHFTDNDVDFYPDNTKPGK